MRGFLWLIGIRYFWDDDEFWEEFAMMLREAKSLACETSGDQRALLERQAEVVEDLLSYLASNLTYDVCKVGPLRSRRVVFMICPRTCMYPIEVAAGMTFSDHAEQPLLVRDDNMSIQDGQIAVYRRGLALDDEGRLILIGPDEGLITRPARAITIFGMDEILRGFLRLMQREQIINRGLKDLCGA